MEIDIEKQTWDDIKATVWQTNPEYFEIVETIAPGADCPLYTVKFPYGQIIGDNISQFIPMKNKEYIRLNHPEIPNYLLQDLGYGKESSPIGMILSKKIEVFLDLPEKKVALPFTVKSPGDFFSFNHVIDTKQNITYAPNGVLYSMSGGRSCFLLPSINCQNSFYRLCRGLQIQMLKPNWLYDHSILFRQMLDSPRIKNDWHSKIVYFSKAWVDNINENPKWYKLKQYFYEIYIKRALFPINMVHYNTSYSLLLEKKNFKPNPYIFDTFKYLIRIMCGHSPGMAPLTDEELLPLDSLQRAFIEHYGFDDISPTIIGPCHFDPLMDNPEPIYYSLQVPITSSFSPKSKKSSVMVELKELHDLSELLLHELGSDTGFCANTMIHYVAKNISTSWHHNSEDIDHIIAPTSSIVKEDARFNSNLSQLTAENGKFFRGCVKIYKKPSLTGGK